MATLYVDRHGAGLKRSGRALAVYEDGHLRSTIPIAMLERVVLSGGVTLDSGVLSFLAEQGVAIMAIGGRRREQLAVLQGRPHNEVARRMAQYRLYDDPVWRLGWSLRLVRHKLAAQERLLRRALRARPDQRLALSRGIGALHRHRASLADGAAAGLRLDQVRGIEGAGAAAYFGAFTSLFAESLGFRGRNRRPPRDPVNAVLSLGYTLLHGDAVQACHMAGLDPLLGYFHDPYYGRESLATDLVEPFRSHVDELAWQLFRERTLRPDQFAQNDGACLMNKSGRAAFYPAYEKTAGPARRALRRLTLKVAMALPVLAGKAHGAPAP